MERFERWSERQFLIPKGCLLHFDSNGNLIAFQEGCMITLVEDSENEQAAGFTLINADSFVHSSWIRETR